LLACTVAVAAVDGWGEDPEKIEAVIKDEPEVLALWREAMVAKPGKRPKKECDIADNISNKRVDAGTSKAYTLDRLKRESPELFAEVCQGNLSANAAAIQAGIRKKPSQEEICIKAFRKATYCATVRSTIESTYQKSARQFGLFFCANGVNMSVEVILSDCRDVVPGLGKFDFIFADPPFNIGHGYTGYDDRRSDFDEFTADWTETCWNACDGVMALHGPDDLAELYIINARRLGMRRIAWVNWHYRFGQCGRGNWIDARCHCLVFAKRDVWTWNPDDVLVTSDRAAVYGDKRIHDTEHGGQRVPGTVWGVPSDGPYWGRVQGNNAERRQGHPNQLPEVYLQRLILAYTNPGDRILDPFGGSGTTAVVADALGRDCVTCDVSEHNVASIRDRLQKGAVRVGGFAAKAG
jgi:site-specific DNA-methyltransferase (adenine-specific)